MGPSEIRKGTQNRHFQRRSVFFLPKRPFKRRHGAKVEKTMKNASKNRRAGKVKSMKIHWFLCVFVKERRSEKSQKIDAKMDPKMDGKSSKNRCGNGFGRFLYRFLGFWRLVKKSIFFDASRTTQKSVKSDQKWPQRRFAPPSRFVSGMKIYFFSF